MDNNAQIPQPINAAAVLNVVQEANPLPANVNPNVAPAEQLPIEEPQARRPQGEAVQPDQAQVPPLLPQVCFTLSSQSLPNM